MPRWTVRGQTCHSLLSVCEWEQISLIDGYKMLRMELEAQQSRALEWNGVHSWVTSLFQWCSKRRINPPKQPANKIQPQACDGDSYKTTDKRLRNWRLTHIQHVRKSNHKPAPDIVNSRKYTSNRHAISNSVFYPQPCERWKEAKNSPEDCHTPLVKFIFQGDIPFLRGWGILH